MTAIDTGVNSNDAEDSILGTAPYRLSFTIRGVADLLFHRWSNEDVAAKQTAKRRQRGQEDRQSRGLRLA